MGKKKRGDAGQKQRRQQYPACVIPAPAGLVRHAEDNVAGMANHAQSEGQLDDAKEQIASLPTEQKHARQNDSKHEPGGMGKIASQAEMQGGMALDHAAYGLEDAEVIEVGGEIAAP